MKKRMKLTLNIVLHEPFHVAAWYDIYIYIGHTLYDDNVKP